MAGTRMAPGGSVAYDANGFAVTSRERLAPPSGGGVSIPPGSTDLTIDNAPVVANHGIMQSLRLVCTVAPAGNGLISIKAGTGGTIVLDIPVFATYLAGQVLFAEFATPIVNGVNANFVADSDVNAGTWTAFINGFYLADSVIGA